MVESTRMCCFDLKTNNFTFHEDNYDIKELLEGEVTVSIFISQREHGVHEQGVGLQAECVSELWRRQLALKDLSGSLARNAAHISSVTLLYFQDLCSSRTVRNGVIIYDQRLISFTSDEHVITHEDTVHTSQQLVLLAWGRPSPDLKQELTTFCGQVWSSSCCTRGEDEVNDPKLIVPLRKRVEWKFPQSEPVPVW